MSATSVLLCIVIGVIALLVALIGKEVNDLRTFFDGLCRNLYATQQIVCTDRELQYLNGLERAYFNPEEYGLRRFQKVEVGEVDGLTGWIVRLEPILPEADPFDYCPFDKELLEADASCSGGELNQVANRIALCVVFDDTGTGKLRLVHASAKAVEDVERASEPIKH